MTPTICQRPLRCFPLCLRLCFRLICSFSSPPRPDHSCHCDDSSDLMLVIFLGLVIYPPTYGMFVSRGAVPSQSLLLIRLSSLADVLFPPDSMKVGLVVVVGGGGRRWERKGGRERCGRRRARKPNMCDFVRRRNGERQRGKGKKRKAVGGMERIAIRLVLRRRNA